MLIDTHCHLDAAEFDADRDAVAAEAARVGVAAIVVPAVLPDNFAAVRACCVRTAAPVCLPAYGTHPLYVGMAGDAAGAQLRLWLEKELAGPHPPVAIGEIGLDYYVPGVDAERQEHLFAEQLRIAREFDLPVLLHVRRAVDAVLKQLRRIRVRGGIAHAFNGSRQQAEAFLALGFKLGFGGAMSFPRATRLRELAATLPADSIVLETDAPDIPPVWLDGGRNTSAHLPAIAGVLAALRGSEPLAIAQMCTANTLAVLPRTATIFPRGG